MKTLELYNFEDPHEVLIWIYDTWGPANSTRWNLRDLRYLDLNNDSDGTYILLKFNTRSLK